MIVIPASGGLVMPAESVSSRAGTQGHRLSA